MKNCFLIELQKSTTEQVAGHQEPYAQTLDAACAAEPAALREHS